MWVKQTKLKSLIILRVHGQKLVDKCDIYRHNIVCECVYNFIYSVLKNLWFTQMLYRIHRLFPTKPKCTYNLWFTQMLYWIHRLFPTKPKCKYNLWFTQMLYRIHPLFPTKPKCTYNLWLTHPLLPVFSIIL